MVEQTDRATAFFGRNMSHPSQSSGTNQRVSGGPTFSDEVADHGVNHAGGGPREQSSSLQSSSKVSAISRGS